MIRSILAALVAASGALAASITVQAGVGTSLIFSPDTVTASPGDTIVFNFGTSIPHTATQSTFDDPCTKSTNSSAFDSGTKQKGGTFTYTVLDSEPVWIYCAVSGHCKGGMVAAINPPTNGSQTFSAFQAKAQGGTAVTTTTTTTTGSGGSSTTGSAKPSSTSTKGAAMRSISSLSSLGSMAIVMVMLSPIALGGAVLI
ncbi:Cupredoxin [Cantharellus anzutake]|uniref:Cupredoxin n=1 Tax=Cantharellus anzutake TaxID=1750568 RepID=UPI001904A4F7|nr:Cupredoxin [Cantharellus anzutake]KAF8325896.1 Cupredoxin [Cantharellus anzutake]